MIGEVHGKSKRQSDRHSPGPYRRSASFVGAIAGIVMRWSSG